MSVDPWLNGRRGQGLAVAVGLLGLAIFWLGVVQPIQVWFSDRSVLLQQRHELLVRIRHVAAGLPALRAASTSRRGEGRDAGTMMLPGDSDAVAAADLQERVQKMAAGAGANLTAVETLPSVAAGSAWHKVELRISLNASWPVLMDLVRSIEQSPTRILIDDVHFRSPLVVVHTAAVPIQASMVLYGFRPVNVHSGNAT